MTGKAEVLICRHVFDGQTDGVVVDEATGDLFCHECDAYFENLMAETEGLPEEEASKIVQSAMAERLVGVCAGHAFEKYKTIFKSTDREQ